MRRLIVLAIALAYAGAAHAQYQPTAPYAGYAPVAPILTPKPPAAFKPYEPPAPFKPYAGQSLYDNGPFSPSAEAKRARKAAEPPLGGPFSPGAAARREREREKHYNPF